MRRPLLIAAVLRRLFTVAAVLDRPPSAARRGTARFVDKTPKCPKMQCIISKKEVLSIKTGQTSLKNVDKLPKRPKMQCKKGE